MGNNPVVEARGTRGQVAPTARGEERGLSAAVGDSGIGCSAQCLEQRQHLHVTTRSSQRRRTRPSWQCARLRQRR